MAKFRDASEGIILSPALDKDLKEDLARCIKRVINFYHERESIMPEDRYSITTKILNQAINGKPGDPTIAPFNRLEIDHKATLPGVLRESPDGSNMINVMVYYIWARCHGEKKFYDKFVKRNFTPKEKHDDADYQDKLRNSFAEACTLEANRLFHSCMRETYPHITRSVSPESPKGMIIGGAGGRRV